MPSTESTPSEKPSGGKLWGGRFTGALDPLMTRYNASISYDRAFYAEDIHGSRAWARANAAVGILTSAELATLLEGLDKVEQEWARGEFEVVEGVDEDIHTANERRLSEIVGKEIGGKLHTGRSRNEQVATDMRLWLVAQLRSIQTHLRSLISTISSRASQELDALMPGYTHLQRGQPIRWSHWLCSYAWSFASDLERLSEVISRVNKSPLGCGALAGNPFGVDRDAIARELGFEGLLMNSLAAVGDRKFVVETLQWASELMTDVSRISEDLIIYSTAEFGFVRLADAYSTGSSLMPQKKNADSLELLRGKSGRVTGALLALTLTTKGLPSTYNKDLQESVEPMLDTIKTTSDSILILTGVVSTLSINKERMRGAVTPDMLATDLAEFLVRKGVPFRETHHVAGRVVALAEREGVRMDALTRAQLASVDERLVGGGGGGGADADDGSDRKDGGKDGKEGGFAWDIEASVERRSARGGTSRSAVLEQIHLLQQIVKGKKE